MSNKQRMISGKTIKQEVMKRHQQKEVGNGEPWKENGSTNGHAGHANGHVWRDTERMHAESAIMGFVHHTFVPLFLMFGSPNGVLIIWYTATQCNGSYAILAQKLTENGILNGLVKLWSSINYFSLEVSVIIAAYCIFAITLQMIMPGPRAEGPVTAKGNVPVYTDNGFVCYLVTMATFLVMTPILKHYGMSPTYVYDHFDEFIGTMTLLSFVFCLFLYVKGRVRPSSADCGTTGNFIFDYYWGTELYPRICGVDVKVFTNCRFGMTMWPLLICIFTLKSYELYGFVDSMWVSSALHMIYMTKFFWWEAGYMRTIDIMVDRAGFYICWGCLVFIGGFYTSTSLYMVTQPVRLGAFWSLLILLLGSLSIALNYHVDYQKQCVRASDGKCLIWGKKPEVIRAQYRLDNGETRESLLLVSGWWGLARHFHYVPELLLAFFWSVPALFHNVMPYSYVLFLLPLLVHRTFRDDHKCSNKYRDCWKEYCAKVPYRMIPYLF